MGLKFRGIVGKSWAASHGWEELGLAHPCYSHSFTVQFGCALQEQLCPSAAINSAALCWHQDKKAPWNTQLGGGGLPSCHQEPPSRSILFTARVNSAHIMILGNPFGQVSLTESRRHGTTLARLKWLSCHWAQQKLGNHSGTGGALNFRTSFCMQHCKSYHDRLKPSYSSSGYFYLIPPQYCTFSIMSPGSNLPSLAITPSR